MLIAFRIGLAGVVGLLAGGGLGWGLATLLCTTFTDVLGPRYAEFDIFGVLGATFLGAVVSAVAAAMIAPLMAYRPPAGGHLLAIGVAVALPGVLLLGLSALVDSEWAWLFVTYLAILLGTFLGVGASRLIPNSSR